MFTKPRHPRPAFLAVVLLAAPPGFAAGPDFEREVAPVLLTRCLECHSGAESSGGLDLSTPRGLRAGGKSGPAVAPGAPDDSFLVQRVIKGEMPPKKAGKSQALPRAEAERLRAWVAAGSPWPDGRTLDPFEATTETRAGRDWWSLQPVRRPPVPVSPGRRSGAGGEPRNPVDAFVLAKLEERGWEMAPPADRRTLIRRLSFDLTGLPPAFADVEAFANDPRPDAYERLVDRLLASPHFGERWGRHWLDVVRYAETCGYERDQTKPHVARYRDWVIAAFNDDLPYDRFVTEQLAGDEVADRSERTVIATGFLRLGTWNDEPNDPQEYKYERLEDMVHATATAFLGLTVKCARCHDHKFDPLRQADYYRMASAFWAGPIEPGPRELQGGPDVKALGFDVLGWTDRPSPPPLRLLKKGEPNRPGPVVEPGHLSLLPSLARRVEPPPPSAKTTRRRLQLAEWVADPSNPLTARVWVNRLWNYHFGQGLVRSPDNFGFTGEKPTHPELLDWLASEFLASPGRQPGEAWTSKRLHRLIVLSSAYRQSSVAPRQDEYAGHDAGNRLWWRAERRRLDAESLRDALLSASGRLDRGRIGGPSFAPDITPEALEGLSMKGAAWKASPPDQQRRRAVYAFTKRGLLPPLLTAFDFGDTTLPCGRRDVTTVAPQALALLNNPFAHDQSEALARRVAAGATDRGSQVKLAWQLALGRSPRPSEADAARAHLDEQQRRLGAERALASLCHVLLNTNEFVYVD